MAVARREQVQPSRPELVAYSAGPAPESQPWLRWLMHALVLLALVAVLQAAL